MLMVLLGLTVVDWRGVPVVVVVVVVVVAVPEGRASDERVPVVRPDTNASSELRGPGLGSWPETIFMFVCGLSSSYPCAK